MIEVTTDQREMLLKMIADGKLLDLRQDSDSSLVRFALSEPIRVIEMALYQGGVWDGMRLESMSDGSTVWGRTVELIASNS